MILKTKRLTLRPWKASDAEALYEYARDARVGPPAGWPPHESVEESRLIIGSVLSAPDTFAVCLGECDRPIGSISLMPNARAHTEVHAGDMEIGYWLAVPYWGQGLMPEAVNRLLFLAFLERGATGVFCGYYDGNDKSRRVMEKCGFVPHHREENVKCSLLDEYRNENFTYLSRGDFFRREGIVAVTARLYLRQMREDDFDALYAVLADSDIMKHYPYVFDGTRVRRWIDVNRTRYVRDGFGLYAVCLRDTLACIGDCGLSMQPINGESRPEVGFHVRADWQRRGIATEAGEAVTALAFGKTDFDKIYSYTYSENVPSVKTAAALGMTRDFTYRDENGELTVSSLTKEAYFRHRGWTLRKATPDDRAATLALYTAVTKSPYSVWSADYPNEREFSRDLACDGLYLLWEGDALLGAFSFESDTAALFALPFWHAAQNPAELSRVCIRPDRQGTGLSRLLVKEAIATAKARGGDVLRLIAAECNPPACRTYEACGFSRVGETFVYGNDYAAYELIFK